MPRTLSRRGSAAAAGIALALSLAGVASAAPTTTYVLPADLGATTAVGTPCAPNPVKKWCTQTREGGVITIAPSSLPRSGPASLYLSTPDTLPDPTPSVSDKAYTLNSTLAGAPLSSLTTLAYESYVITPGRDNPQQAPALNIEIDRNGPSVAGGYSVLVWEPIYTGATVVPGQWQSWTPSASNGWWSTRDVVLGVPQLPQFPHYSSTFAQVKAALPDAIIVSIGVNQGGGNPGLSSNVDLLTVNNTVYDFELDANHDGIADTAPPTSKDQCKDDGWKTFNNPTFKNQGDCVSYVATH